jgi:RNase P subunit RPR2
VGLRVPQSRMAEWAAKRITGVLKKRIKRRKCPFCCTNLVNDINGSKRADRRD